MPPAGHAPSRRRDPPGVLAPLLEAAAIPGMSAVPSAPARVAAPTVVSFPHRGDVMTVASQNAMVHTICIQCHTDRRKPGGLSFEHFDMASAPAHAKIAEDMLAKLRAGHDATRDRAEAARRGLDSRVRRVARDADRSGRRASPRSRLPAVAAVEPGGVHRFDPFDAGAHRGRQPVAAARHDEPQLRQHRGGAGSVADLAAELSGSGR